MNNVDFWDQALLSALCRLPLSEALNEAETASQARAVVIDRKLKASPSSAWIGNVLKGWPTPEDMKRVIRSDGSDFILTNVDWDE